MLCIDGFPWALAKAEDECCAYGAKQIRKTPFPIGSRSGSASVLACEILGATSKRDACSTYRGSVTRPRNKQTPLGTC
jgi:hypothetical protein